MIAPSVPERTARPSSIASKRACYRVDILFRPTAQDQEPDVSAFLRSVNTFDLGIVHGTRAACPAIPLPGRDVGVAGIYGSITPILSSWLCYPITLRTSTPDDSTLALSAPLASRPGEELELAGRAPRLLVEEGGNSLMSYLDGLHICCEPLNEALIRQQPRCSGRTKQPTEGNEIPRHI